MCFCHVSPPEDRTTFQAQGCHPQPEAAETGGGSPGCPARGPHRLSACGPAQTRAWWLSLPRSTRAGAPLHAKRQELRRPTPCRGYPAPREATEGQEAADPSPPRPSQRSLRPLTKPLRGRPAAPPDHQQPQTKGKWDPGPQLSRGSPSGIKRDAGVGGDCPQAREVSAHSSMQTGATASGPPAAHVSEVALQAAVVSGEVVVKTPADPGPRRKGTPVFLPGRMGCILSRGSHAHDDGQFCGF